MLIFMGIMIDYYKILGLEPGATEEQIRKAYRELAKMYHPDLNDSSQATDFFVRLNQAYQVLSNESERIVYDQKYLCLKAKNDQAKQFHYDRMQGSKAGLHVSPRYLAQLFFGLEMFLGFLEALLVLGYVFRGPAQPAYGVFSIPGILLVIDGWKGILGRKSVLGGCLKWLKENTKK
jgi:hypothetical protein